MAWLKMNFVLGAELWATRWTDMFTVRALPIPASSSMNVIFFTKLFITPARFTIFKRVTSVFAPNVNTVEKLVVEPSLE